MDEKLYSQFYRVETDHWWFSARRTIVKSLVEERIKLPPGSKVLDVGCGTGAVLEMLSRNYQAYGTDVSRTAIEYCRRRGLENVYECTLDTFPLKDVRFDLLLFLDVLEHLDDDIALLRQAENLMSDTGWLLVTVPAYKILWSAHDDLNHHKRRYTKRGLRRTLGEAGYRVELISYFNTLLFPAAALNRLAGKLLGWKGDDSLEIPSMPVNSALRAVFSLEKSMLGNVPMPFGLSVLALATR